MSSSDNFIPIASDLLNLSNEIEELLVCESVALLVWEASESCVCKASAGSVLIISDRKILHWFLEWLQKRIGDSSRHIAMDDRSRVYAAALDAGLWLRDASHLPMKSAPVDAIGDLGGRLGLLISAMRDAYEQLSHEEGAEEIIPAVGCDD